MEKMIVNLEDVELENSPLFEQYVDYKEQFDFELKNRTFVRTYLPKEEREQKLALEEKIKKVSFDTLKEKADELVRAQKLEGKHGELLEHMIEKSNGNFGHFKSLWSPIMWQANENHDRSKVKIGDKVFEVYGLDFVIAESLQQIYSSEDPRAEYHDWIERQQKIEFDINTQGTTEEEIVARNSFIVFLDDRETDIKRIISLYSAAAFNPNCKQQQSAQEKLKFLTFKLSELRRLRQKTENTKAYADSKEFFELQERRQQRDAIAATAGITAMALTDNAFSLADMKQNNQNILEHGAGETFVNLQPETTSAEQAKAKIATIVKHRENIRAMFVALRNGMSREEWEKNNLESHQSSSDIAAQIQRLRGFNRDRFNQMA